MSDTSGAADDETEPTGFGQNLPNDGAGEFNPIQRQINRVLANVRTSMPVVVVSVTDADGNALDPGKVTSHGFVSVQPAVRMQNGDGETQSMAVVNNVPYVRCTSGRGAIINDPKAGDKGVLVCCDRDISSFKKTLAEANPGSSRMFSMADGVFFPLPGGEKPRQYIQFLDDEILITPDDTETTSISIKAGAIVFRIGQTVLKLTLDLFVAWANKTIVHGITEASIDADGTGYQFIASLIERYGSDPTGLPDNPPAVPLAEANDPEE